MSLDDELERDGETDGERDLLGDEAGWREGDDLGGDSDEDARRVRDRVCVGVDLLGDGECDLLFDWR